MMKWLIKHGFVSKEKTINKWADYAVSTQLEEMGCKMAVLYGWLDGDRMKKFEEMADRTHKLFKQDLDRWRETERVRESNLALTDLRTELHMLIEHLGLEEVLRKKYENEHPGTTGEL
jgi:hypothetical protein